MHGTEQPIKQKKEKESTAREQCNNRKKVITIGYNYQVNGPNSPVKSYQNKSGNKI